MIFYGTIKDLSFKPDNQRSWLDYLEQNDKKKVIIEIELDKAKRSLDQNALYWLYLGHIEKETGNIANDLHELFKRIFLPPIPKTILGKSIRIPASTKTLKKGEFGEYLDKIAAFTEIPIPEPIKKEFDIPAIYSTEQLTPKF